MREKLAAVQVGLQIWERLDHSTNWTETKTSSPQKDHAYAEAQGRDGKRLVVALYSMKGESGRWKWTDGIQDSISQLMRETMY